MRPVESDTSLSLLFFKIIAHDAHLQAHNQETARTSAFTETLTLTDGTWIKRIWEAAPGWYLPLIIPMEIGRVYLLFSTADLHCSFVFFLDK